MMQDQQIRKKVRDFYNRNAMQWSATRKNWWQDLTFIKDYLDGGASFWTSAAAMVG